MSGCKSRIEKHLRWLFRVCSARMIDACILRKEMLQKLCHNVLNLTFFNQLIYFDFFSHWRKSILVRWRTWLLKQSSRTKAETACLLHARMQVFVEFLSWEFSDGLLGPWSIWCSVQPHGDVGRCLESELSGKNISESWLYSNRLWKVPLRCGFVQLFVDSKKKLTVEEKVLGR